MTIGEHLHGRPTRLSKHHRLRRAQRTVTHLEQRHDPYSFGGGRTPQTFSHGPGDCSWGAARLIDAFGLPLGIALGSISTYSLAGWGEAGAGRLLTLFIKNPPDPHQAHVITCLGPTHHAADHPRHPAEHPEDWHWAEVGGRDNPEPGGGMSWFKPTVDRVAEFDIRRHFHGC